MMWPFRRSHRPEDAPSVVEAREKRDLAFKVLGEAVKKVDRLHDRIVTEYENAEYQRLERRAQRFQRRQR